MRPRWPEWSGEPTPATSATASEASPTEDASTAQPAETQPDATPVTQLPAESSHRSNRKIVAVGVAALLVLGALGVASTQIAFGVPTPTATQPPSAATRLPGGTNPPFLGSTQGCDASFWVMPDHYSAWQEYVPGQRVGSLFGHAAAYADMTLAEALGNPTSGESTQRALLREAVTAVLNAANDSLAFPYSRYDTGVDGRPPIVPTANRLFTTGIDADIVGFTSDLSAANHLGCPF